MGFAEVAGRKFEPVNVTPAKLLRFATDPGYARMVLRTNAQRWLLKRRRREGIADPPTHLTVFLTDRCNLRCSFCGQWGDYGVCKDRPAQVMAPETLLALLDQVRGWKPWIMIIGGEPMLYRHGIVWAVEQIAARGMNSYMITNGTFLPKYGAELVKAGLTMLSVSIDGPREVHDRIRGEGCYDRIMEGIAAVHKAKQERGSMTPELTIAATVSKESYRDLPRLAEALREVADVKRLIIQHLSFLVPKQMEAHNRQAERLFGIKSENVEGLTVAPGDFETAVLKDVFARLQSESYPFEVAFGPRHPLDDIDAYYANDESYTRKRTTRCEYIWNMTSIYPDGEVTPCMGFGAGKITERPFLEIWNSDRYKHFRATLHREGFLPACHRCCYE